MQRSDLGQRQSKGTHPICLKHQNNNSHDFLTTSKHVPLPLAMCRCECNCCMRTHVPLDLCHARTMHKFQGLSAGPVDKGKIPNPHMCITCDPDKKDYEKTALGLFCTAVSRATTLGDDTGLNSAIYFTGDEFGDSRIRRLNCMKHKDTKFVLAQKRENWVAHLKMKELMCKPTISKVMKRKADTLEHHKTNQCNYEKVFHRLEQHKRSKTTGGFEL